MEELIEEQNEIINKLNIFVRNHKKTAKLKLTTGYFRGRLEHLHKIWNSFDEKHDAIMGSTKLCDPNNLPSYITKGKYEAMEEFYCNLVSEFKDQIDSLTIQPSTSHDNNTRVETITRNNFNLPQITLPKFNGNYNQWMSFKDLFKSMIHTNTQLSGSQKLHYLKSNLSGDAEQLLRHFDITDGNYTPAWKLMMERYDNKRVLINTHLKTLMSQPNINNETTYTIKNILDTTVECLHSIQKLEVDITNWDPLIVYIITQKLSIDTHKLWEQHLGGATDVPNWDKLKEFLELRFRTLEAISMNTGSKSNAYNNKFTNYNKNNMNTYKTYHGTDNKQIFHLQNNEPCLYCKGEHFLWKCEKFLKLNYTQRMNEVMKRGVCINCLGHHYVRDCKSDRTCRSCNKKHNTLLHENKNWSAKQPSDHHLKNISEGISPTICQSNHLYQNKINNHHVLLPTALVEIHTNTGKHILRALIDQGSQANFIVESVVQRLQLNKKHCVTQISGIDQTKVTTSKNIVRVQCRSKINEYSINLEAIVLKTLSSLLPSESVEISDSDYLKNIKLADPYCFEPGPIELLLGAEVYAEILIEGVLKGGQGRPLAQNTALGWIVSGPIGKRIDNRIEVKSHFCQMEINDKIEKFWKIEEVEKKKPWSTEEIAFEDHYKLTHRRDTSGRYILKLPFNDTSELGNSKYQALSRFRHIETKFEKDSEYKKLYVDNINEYFHLNQIELSQEKKNEKAIYLPHHAVLKPSSTTTKCRIVFDASAKTSSGVSLNDKLLSGPILQPEMIELLLGWRKYPIVFTADIEKMYRQIMIAKEDRIYQNILWREDQNQPITSYELKTVTFGTKSAPFMAIRTLIQVAIDNKEKYPIASQMLNREMYVDDLISGAYNITEAIEKQMQIINSLESGGFHLRKWSSNNKIVLENIPITCRENNLPIQLDLDQNIKTLGIHWDPNSDFFSFKFIKKLLPEKLTKRNVLSQIASLYDPLGWIAPIIISGKLIMQKLWLLQVKWDEELPEVMCKTWNDFYENLNDINNIKISRWMGIHSECHEFELHGFCDASASAYAAVVYSRVRDEKGKIKITLLTSKTRVAPIKQISIPRLELCGAVLLTRLLNKIKASIGYSEVITYAWTDSTIVLSWLQGHPNRWQIFVANRVSEILDTRNVQWRYVPTKQNPADHASRGLKSNELIHNELWWNGPDWLQKQFEDWPAMAKVLDTKIELKKTENMHAMMSTVEKNELLDRWSSLSKLIRITTICKRFINNAKLTHINRQSGKISKEEIENSLNYWIKTVQISEFSEEMENLKNKMNLSKSSKILTLNPFLDKNGILRVGGRLKNAECSYNQKYPMILPHNSPFTTLLISHAHITTLHGGTQLTLNYLRKDYWILRAKNTIKHFIHKCTICFRYNSDNQKQLMGNLPRCRVTQSRPFMHTGMDYAGPIELKYYRGRSKTFYKGYIAIFICMCTTAVHIEIVTDQTTESFLAAFRRFVSRRGICSDVYSDNGSNFIGAEKYLNEFGMKWHFIPSHAPSFGGLWEAGVKSIKYHLRRIVGASTMTYEELSTILTQIEACLNSRPLIQITDNPEDYNVITPGHFLIGEALLTTPEANLLDRKTHLLRRWQFLQQCYQTFWKSWQSDYLSNQQRRSKWNNVQKNIRKNNMVILKEDNIPPSKWLMGRIIEVHPGQDGLIRVVTVRTQNSVYKRPISKICLLPIMNNHHIEEKTLS